MKRSEIWTVAGGPGYADKPRPVLIMQDDRFAATVSVTVCPFTSDPTNASLLRLPVEPSETNGLASSSELMVDKITSIARTKLGKRVGRLADQDMRRLNRTGLVFLGLAG